MATIDAIGRVGSCCGVPDGRWPSNERRVLGQRARGGVLEGVVEGVLVDVCWSACWLVCLRPPGGAWIIAAGGHGRRDGARREVGTHSTCHATAHCNSSVPAATARAPSAARAPALHVCAHGDGRFNSPSRH